MPPPPGGSAWQRERAAILNEVDAPAEEWNESFLPGSGASMVQINMGAREIVLKIEVYYGPTLSGKTTNLQQLHAMLDPASRSQMVTLDTKDDRTLYFDFIPIEFSTSTGFAVKLKVFSVPGQVMHKSTRKVVLSGADAVAFVADSQRSSASANAYSYRAMEACPTNFPPLVRD